MTTGDPNPVSGVDFTRMSAAERIELAQALWDSIANESNSIPLTRDQRELLQQRLAGADRDRTEGRTDRNLSWDETVRRVREAG